MTYFSYYLTHISKSHLNIVASPEQSTKYLYEIWYDCPARWIRHWGSTVQKVSDLPCAKERGSGHCCGTRRYNTNPLYMILDGGQRLDNVVQIRNSINRMNLWCSRRVDVSRKLSFLIIRMVSIAKLLRCDRLRWKHVEARSFPIGCMVTWNKAVSDGLFRKEGYSSST